MTKRTLFPDDRYTPERRTDTSTSHLGAAELAPRLTGLCDCRYQQDATTESTTEDASTTLDGMDASTEAKRC